MEKLKNIQTFEQHSDDENMRVIRDSYDDYVSIPDNHKEVFARQIALCAKGYIRFKDSKLEDWLKVFADEDLVISKLNDLRDIKPFHES